MIDGVSLDTALLAVLLAWAAWVTKAVKRLIKHCPLLNHMDGGPDLPEWSELLDEDEPQTNH